MPCLFLFSDTLLRDIPASVHQKIINLLNVEDTFGRNWHAIAGCMGLTVNEAKTLKDEKMNGLFERMTQQNMCVKDLLGFLTNKDVDRQDVIEELKDAGLVNDDGVSSFADVESSDTSDSTKENSGL